MINNGSKTELKIGDRLITKGEAIENLYIILSGKFSIVDGESQKNIAYIGSGEIVGEMSFLESRPPSVSVIARELSSVFCISKKLMNKRLNNNLEFKANFYYAISLFLSHRLRQTTTQLGYGSSEEIDAIDENVLDGISQAGSRFSQILQKFSEV
jgi:CRP-like cAMP-binding protein